MDKKLCVCGCGGEVKSKHRTTKRINGHGRKKYQTDEERRQAACKCSNKYDTKNMETIKRKARENYNHLIQKDRTLKYEWGISLLEYNQMLSSQDGTCAICKKAPRTRKLCVDHNHNTGKIRGLLCFHCNTLLGKASESIEILQEAITYLKERN